MRVLVKPPIGAPTFREIDDNDKLDGMKEVVGGYIERIPFESWHTAFEGTDIDLFADEESKLKLGWQGRINFSLPDPTGGEMHDVVVGRIFFCTHDGEGESLSITDEQAKMLCNYFGWQKPEGVA